MPHAFLDMITRSKNRSIQSTNGSHGVKDRVVPQSTTTGEVETITLQRQDFYYLSPQAQSTLPSFEYSGKDYSLIFQHVLSPLASFLVYNCTPIWIAPNTITLIGLFFMLASYSFMWAYIPNLSEGFDAPESVPSWIFLFNAIAMLVYQTLDNMDGKQARRTQKSSPLGLLFDHGCDAFNSIPGAVNWACAFGLGFRSNPMQAWFVITCPMTLFYITTLEEYYSGKMILPVINGPTEGLLAGACFSLCSYLWGVSYWHETSWYDSWIEPHMVQKLPASVSLTLPNGLSNKDIMYWVCVLWLVQEESLKIYHIARKYGIKALTNLFPFFFLMSVSMCVWMCDSELVIRNIRTCLHIVSGLFVEMTIQLMLDHMSKEVFHPYRATLAPLGLLAILVAANSIREESADDYLLGYMVGIWVYVLCKIQILIHEMSNLLKIWCFDITTPWQPR